MMVKFEDLVGPMGGSAETQRRIVERVARHVGLESDERLMRTVEENIFGVSNTFRKGQIGGWCEEFSEEHMRSAREIAGPLLVELGANLLVAVVSPLLAAYPGGVYRLGVGYGRAR